MKIIKHIPLLLLTLVSLSSCFEYIEEVTYIDSQSGKCQLTLNCSQSKNKLNTLLKLDTFMGIKVPNRGLIESELSRFQAKLKTCEGIGEVKLSKDFHNYIFSLEFKFDSTHHLNNAIWQCASEMGAYTEKSNPDILHYEAGIFSKIYPWADSIPNNRATKKTLKMFSDATCMSIYRFPNKIKSADNSDTKISPSRKAAMLKCTVKELLANPKQLNNTIYIEP